jgi:aryl carrier-like protein
VELNFGATQNPLDSMTIMYVLEKSRKNGVLARLLERLKKKVLGGVTCN